MLTTAWLVLGLVFGSAFLAYVDTLHRSKRRALATGLAVAAVIYVGFAAVGGSATWILYETSGVAIFGLLAWLGVRHSPIWLAVGWALHPIWDGILHLRGTGAIHAPEWYVVACISFDLLVAAFIQWKRNGL